MAYNNYNFSTGEGDTYLDKLRAATLANQQSQQQKQPNAFESFFNWIGDTAGAIGNTLKDTVGAIGSIGATSAQNLKRESTIKANQAKLDNIAKKYGFNSYNEISDDAWKNNQEMVNELKQASKENTDTLTKQANDYKNNWAVKNTANVKQNEYGANAIKTWNTLADVLTAPVSMPASMAINAGQGVLSGIGDQLQETGEGQSFDWGNALKRGSINAAAGVAGGAAGSATGKLGNKLASGGKISKLGGRLLNNGIGRGAIAGAAGGATGAGLSTLGAGGSLEEVLRNAAAGAGQGAGTGAVTGAGMSLLNAGVNKAKSGIDQLASDKYNRSIKNALNSPAGASTMLDALDEAASPTLRGGVNKSKENINAVRNLQKNKGAKVLYDATDGAATASTTDYDSAASRAIADSTSIVPQEGTDVNTDAAVKAQKKLLATKSRKQRETAAKDLLNQVGTVSKPAAKAYHMVDNVVELSKRGLTTPEQWEVASDSITGRNGKLSKLYTKITNTAGNIDTTSGVNGADFDATIDKIISDNGMAGTTDGKALKAEIDGALGMLQSRQEGSITGLDDAADVMDVVRNLEKKVRNYRGDSGGNYSTTTPYKEQKANAIQAVATLLEDRVYDKVGDISPIMTEDVLTDLKNIFPGNKKWANYVDNDLAKIKTGKELRAAQKPYVQSSNYLSAVKENYGTYGQKVGDVYGNVLAQGLRKVPVVGGLLAQAADAPVANRAYAKIHEARANSMENKIANMQDSQTPAPATNRAIQVQNQATDVTNAVSNTDLPYALIGRLSGTEEASQAAKNPQTYASPTNLEQQLGNSAIATGNMGYGNTGTAMGTSTGYGNSYSGTGNEMLDRLVGGMENALNAGDISAFSQLADIYNTLSKVYGVTSGSSTGSQKLSAT